MRIYLWVFFILFTGVQFAEDINVLENKLRDAELPVRADAATALGKMGEAASSAVPALIMAFKQAYKDMPTEDTSALLKAATIAFGQIGPKAKDSVPLLEYAIKHEGSFAAADALCKIVPERIGDFHEMMAAHWCKLQIDTQAMFSITKKGRSGKAEYSQRLNGEDSLDSLSPAAFSNADGDLPNPKPLYNYHFRILKAQGDKVPGGKKSYLADGKMTLGAAFVAYPVEYGVKGKKTFLIALVDGFKKLYSKDLGGDSAKLGKEIAEFNPDNSWKEEDAEWGFGPASAPEFKP